MRETLLSLLLKHHHPHVTQVTIGEQRAVIKEPGHEPNDVSLEQAGGLLAGAVVKRMEQKQPPLAKIEESSLPLGWLCTATQGFNDSRVGALIDAAQESLHSQWRDPAQIHRDMVTGRARPQPPAVIRISGQTTPRSADVVPAYGQELIKQGMISHFPEIGHVRRLVEDPFLYVNEQAVSTDHALRRLGRAVTIDVANGTCVPHAVLVIDGDHPPEPIEELVDIALTFTCETDDARRHPVLAGSFVNLFPVVIEQQEQIEEEI